MRISERKPVVLAKHLSKTYGKNRAPDDGAATAPPGLHRLQFSLRLPPEDDGRATDAP